jgi:hypothetical protein
MMRDIFVFGSNLAGRHGAGSARAAMEKHEASYGVGVGFSGSSYAIPTKDRNIKTMSLEEIEPHVHEFLAFARDNHDWTFNVVAIGCGLAGYTPSQIAPMFKHAPGNCNFIGGWNEPSD